MSTTKVLIIGATGFIGAAVFDLVYAKHPEYSYTVLMRSKEKAAELLARYPLINPLISDMSNTQLLESEAEKANIVISKLQY
jgi:N-acetyl-gamma-glutamylphosphate reductase